MREKMYITAMKNTDMNEIELWVQEETTLTELVPAGQMLVDSDEISFTYLLEKNDEYTYLMIGEETWSDLYHAIKKNARVTITNGHERKELINFREELEYLVENIKGNSNYGEKMVERVEAVFQ